MPRKSEQLEKPYKGKLNKPIIISDIQPKTDKIFEADTSKVLGQFYADNSFVIKELTERMKLLLKHYEIESNDENRWYELALNLAKNHVPGFRVEGKSGKKTGWTPQAYAKLYFDVQRERLFAKNLNVATIGWACNRLIKKSPWKNFKINKNDKTLTAKTLQNKYSEAQSSVLITAFLRNQKEAFFTQNLQDLYIEMVDKMFMDNQNHFP